jgi:hypothetical protein
MNGSDAAVVFFRLAEAARMLGEEARVLNGHMEWTDNEPELEIYPEFLIKRIKDGLAFKLEPFSHPPYLHKLSVHINAVNVTALLTVDEYDLYKEVLSGETV